MSVKIISCPFCNAKSFVFPLEGIQKFLCHSCQRYSSLDFISRFINNNVNKKSSEIDYSPILSKAVVINNLPSDHHAVKFFDKRRIPTKYKSELYYVNNFKDFLSGTKYDNVKDVFPKIIIPLKSNKGLFGVQARSLDKKDKGPKYTTIKFVDCATVYGKEFLDKNKPVVVVEGPIDSMFIENSIAVTGSGFTKIDFDADFIYCLDNEPRNKSIVNIMAKLLKEEKKVVIWPEKIKEKDINDMVINGIDANSVIHENVYSGAKALIKLSMWKKV